MSLAYKRDDFPQPPDSFGFVVPAIEKRKIMACTFSSLKYPGRAPEGAILLRAFVGGSLQSELLNDDNAAMEQNVRAEIASLLGVKAEPILRRIWRHPNSMPQYHVGHEERVRSIQAALREFPTLALAGSAYSGVGISDCVRSGEEAAEAVIEAIGNRVWQRLPTFPDFAGEGAPSGQPTNSLTRPHPSYRAWICRHPQGCLRSIDVTWVPAVHAGTTISRNIAK